MPSTDQENVLRGVFATLPVDSQDDDGDVVLDDPQIDEVLGEPPYEVRRKKSRRTLWYRVAQAHSRTLKARHRDAVWSYVKAVERLAEVEREINRLPSDQRYTDATRQHRMWRRHSLDERDQSLKALRSLTPFGKADAV